MTTIEGVKVLINFMIIPYHMTTTTKILDEFGRRLKVAETVEIVYHVSRLSIRAPMRSRSIIIIQVNSTCFIPPRSSFGELVSHKYTTKVFYI